ncbi:MAG: molybdopterin molybdotransferase [Gaiellales bacterium]|nr:molybdopterin molybdotransferase [Gaiellales bacterium]
MSDDFTVRTLAEALAGFRPAHVTTPRRVALAEAAGLAAARDVHSPRDLPGFTRSAVDGFAVRSADTRAAGEQAPCLLEVAGAVSIGRESGLVLAPGQAIEIPTGGAVPAGADAVVMIEQTTPAGGYRVALTRAARPGDNVVKPDDDVASGGLLIRTGRVVRPHDVGLLASAGVTELEVHPRPSVAIVSTGDELVAAEREPGPAEVRDANAPALAALVAELGGAAVAMGIVPDDPAALEAVCRDALGGCDLLVISAGSSVGARDATARVVGRLGPPGIWCHGLAIRPGRPTLLAEVMGRPLIGLPGNPVSALVVMRLIAGRLIAGLAGRDRPSPQPVSAATLAGAIASAAGRLDVVQVALQGDVATPLFGKAARLSVLGRADGYLLVPEAVTELPEGARVEVELYR